LQPLLQRWQSQSEADRAVLMVLGHSIGLAPEASCGSRPQLGLDRPFYVTPTIYHPRANFSIASTIAGPDFRAGLLLPINFKAGSIDVKIHHADAVSPTAV
jgi:hypothetical protein